MKRLIGQVSFFFLTNANLKGFVTGKIYKGDFKKICVPGLNCYSCPGAIGSCPIGALQAVMGSMRYSISLYITGLLTLFGIALGRFICGWLCPFGLLQDLLSKMKKKKKRLPQYLYHLRYFILIVFVIGMPLFITNQVGMGDPTFCKYICPSGTLFGAVPLLIKNIELRQLLGALFTWKMGLLIAILGLSVVYHRFFCKVMCPLGLIYGAFNKYSVLQYSVDKSKCNQCGACERVCEMDVIPYENPNSSKCIRCGRCKTVCRDKLIKTTTIVKEKTYE